MLQGAVEVFLSLSPLPSHSLNPPELKHLLPAPEELPSLLLPAMPVSVLTEFSLGLPFLAFFSLLWWSTSRSRPSDTRALCTDLQRKGENSCSKFPPLSPQMHELVPYKSCVLDLIIHVRSEGNDKACLFLSSYFNDYSVWINYSLFGIFWKVCGWWCEIWFYKNRRADHSCDHEVIYSWENILYLYWELRKSS